ncbi:16S rRNA (cytidine(1402)-2'-O)-methyltransferase [Tepidibacter formicigenes]|jgi:16S rRNA (cytidine1402-2'-O)-methyltransferase|uniref:Ribosomal RNA small subunit methyltransferase I n=1 Tax=Tepidibacter formicigenes DSM 15518 TaxID=1123349 RepID=A0A1M6PPE9_9FIRM|nr:16S rRNA (cytidine(1402)-2'-O)-methyltransferase [Tepidibacter formicigenes]SHK09781.1 16S rRNA (cytidine1402-2'-O)-methyltransferase [Tepidibacter formicigenes DSM 15518]
MKGKLFVCATPIGNLEDITIRTLNVLKEVDLIAAEDTRHSIKLLNYFNISKPLTSYHEHNKETKGRVIIDKILSGENVAIITDAGMPGISDPGEDIIKIAINEGIDVEVLPGATAFVTALVGSGLFTRKFAFEGFLDRDKKNRKKELEDLKYEKRTLIFYESPHRLKNTLEDMLSILGNRNICISRELTKKYEEIIRSNIEDSIKIFKSREIKGEFVLIVEGFNGEVEKINNNDDLDIREYVIKLIDEGMSKKDAIKYVAKERKLHKNEVYQEVLDI